MPDGAPCHGHILSPAFKSNAPAEPVSADDNVATAGGVLSGALNDSCFSRMLRQVVHYTYCHGSHQSWQMVMHPVHAYFPANERVRSSKGPTFHATFAVQALPCAHAAGSQTLPDRNSDDAFMNIPGQLSSNGAPLTSTQRCC